MPGESIASWLAVSKWVDDGTPFPGEAFRQGSRSSINRTSYLRERLSFAGS